MYHDYDFNGEVETTVENVVNTTKSSGVNIEFILLVSAVALLAIIFVISIIVLVKVLNMKNKVDVISVKVGNMEANSGADIGVVFCKKCGSNYSVNDKKCPYCGEKR